MADEKEILDGQLTPDEINAREAVDDLFRAETVKGAPSEPLTADRHVDESAREQSEAPIISEMTAEDWQQATDARNAAVDFVQELQQHLQTIVDKTPKGESLLSQEQLNDVAVLVNKGLVEDKGSESELVDSANAEHELKAVLSEVEQAIAHIREKISAVGDVVPGLSDHLSNLEDVRSEIQSLVTALNMGMISVDMVKDMIASLQVGVQQAAGSANVEANISVSEFKAEVYNEVYEAVAQARQEYMRSLVADSPLYHHVNDTLIGINPAFANISPKIQQNIAVGVAQHAMNDPKGTGVAVLVAQNLTDDSKRKISEQKQKDLDHFWDMYNSLDADDPRKKRLDDLIQSVGGKDALNVMINDRFVKIADRVLDQNADTNKIDQDISDISKQTYVDRMLTLQNMPAELRQKIMDNRPDGMGSKEYINSLSLDPSAINTDDPKLKDALTQFAGQYSFIAITKQTLAYTKSLGLEKDLVDELSQMTPEEIKERLANDNNLQGFREFIEASPSQKTEMMLEAGALDSQYAGVATGMYRAFDYGLSKLPESERMTEGLALTSKVLEAMEANSIQGKLAKGFGENPDARAKLLIEADRNRRELESNKIFNPEGLDFTRHPELYHKLLELSANGNLTDEQWHQAREELSVEITAAVEQDAVSLDEIARYSYDISNVKRILDYQYNDQYKYELLEIGDYTAQGLDQMLAGRMYTELRERNMSDDAARIVVAKEFEIAGYQPTPNEIMPYLDAEAQKVAAASMIDFIPQDAGDSDYAEQEQRAREGYYTTAYNKLAAEEYQRDPSRFVNPKPGSSAESMRNAALEHLIAEQTSAMQKTHPNMNYDERREQATQTVKIQMAINEGASAEGLIKTGYKISDETLVEEVLKRYEKDGTSKQFDADALKKMAVAEVQLLKERQAEEQQLSQQDDEVITPTDDYYSGLLADLKKDPTDTSIQEQIRLHLSSAKEKEIADGRHFLDLSDEEVERANRLADEELRRVLDEIQLEKAQKDAAAVTINAGGILAMSTDGPGNMVAANSNIQISDLNKKIADKILAGADPALAKAAVEAEAAIQQATASGVTGEETTQTAGASPNSGDVAKEVAQAGNQAKAAGTEGGEEKTVASAEEEAAENTATVATAENIAKKEEQAAAAKTASA